MQKNYISKEQAEVQLENELQQLRLQNGQKIKEMEDKHSRELLERTKEVADRKQQEFNIIQEGLRKTNTELEKLLTERAQELKTLKEEKMGLQQCQVEIEVVQKRN